MASVVIRIPNWLGDAVMASAAIDCFRAQHPHDDISLLGLPQTLSVFEHSPHRYHLIDFNRSGRHAGFSGMVRLAWYLRELHFDTGYLLTNSFSSALLFKLADIPQRVGYAGQLRNWLLTDRIVPPDGAVHQVKRYAHLFSPNGVDRLAPSIAMAEDEQELARAFLLREGLTRTPLIGLAIGAAYGPAKRWPAERFGLLARRCEEELGAAVILLGSRSEIPLAEQARQAAGAHTVNLAGKTSLRELFALIRLCRLVVSNDSGLMHASVALGTPVVALFGPTEARETSPYGGNYQIIKHDLPCSPCMKRECPLGHHDCMNLISVEEVFDSLKTNLAASSSAVCS